LNIKDIEGFLFFPMDSCALIWSMVQEICFIEVDEYCWNFELGRFAGNWLFQNFDQDLKWKLRKLWIPTA
jgi:hypothetical protein